MALYRENLSITALESKRNDSLQESMLKPESTLKPPPLINSFFQFITDSQTIDVNLAYAWPIKIALCFCGYTSAMLLNGSYWANEHKSE